MVMSYCTPVVLLINEGLCSRVQRGESEDSKIQKDLDDDEEEEEGDDLHWPDPYQMQEPSVSSTAQTLVIDLEIDGLEEEQYRVADRDEIEEESIPSPCL